MGSRTITCSIKGVRVCCSSLSREKGVSGAWGSSLLTSSGSAPPRHGAGGLLYPFLWKPRSLIVLLPARPLWSMLHNSCPGGILLKHSLDSQPYLKSCGGSDHVRSGHKPLQVCTVHLDREPSLALCPSAHSSPPTHTACWLCSALSCFGFPENTGHLLSLSLWGLAHPLGWNAVSPTLPS